MARILIVGAGGVGGVVAHKAATMPCFSEVMLASRTAARVEAVAAQVRGLTGRELATATVDADDVPALTALLRKFRPETVINVALPYQDLHIMEACLAAGVNYLDTANYEPPEVAHFEYSWQWAYKKRFEDAGLMALLGCGFDPGVSGIFTAYAQKHVFDEIHYVDIVDCNAGDHGKAFATNFNPEINIREITQNGRYWEHGRWIETKPLEIHQGVDYPEVGVRESYLLYHEELESLVKNIPHLRRARFWMTFGQKYINVLSVLQEVGMTSITPVHYNGMDIQPLQFLKAVLPKPETLGENYTGQTSIGCQLRGIKDGTERTYFIWNNCDHAACYRECRSQGVSYTTGVPAALGAKMMATGLWRRPGVWNVEEFDPDPFLAELAHWGLPWHFLLNPLLAFSP
ncbi:MAG: saccharopine dehydrogenase family protein [Kiritimatiellaeota bacterium]|nr:saccharopine dehydrogenase family protein [Kiritimatiellota bacterium]